MSGLETVTSADESVMIPAACRVPSESWLLSTSEWVGYRQTNSGSVVVSTRRGRTQKAARLSRLAFENLGTWKNEICGNKSSSSWVWTLKRSLLQAARTRLAARVRTSLKRSLLQAAGPMIRWVEHMTVPMNSMDRMRQIQLEVLLSSCEQCPSFWPSRTGKADGKHLGKLCVVLRCENYGNQFNQTRTCATGKLLTQKILDISVFINISLIIWAL
jgi:hypothetical protein